MDTTCNVHDLDSSAKPNDNNSISSNGNNDDDGLLFEYPADSFAVLDLDVQSVALQVHSDYGAAPQYPYPYPYPPSYPVSTTPTATACDTTGEKTPFALNCNTVRREEEKLIKAGASGKRWSGGLFSCLDDVPGCLLVLFCPCIVEALMGMRMNNVRLGVTLCCFTVLVCTLTQLYYVLVGTAMLNAERDTLEMMSDLAEESHWVWSGSVPPEEGEEGPTDYMLINTFSSAFRTSPAWIAAQLLAVLCGLFTVARLVAAAMLRVHARNLYNIGNPGDRTADLKDAMSIFFCYSCTLCQLKSTVEQHMRQDTTPQPHVERI